MALKGDLLLCLEAVSPEKPWAMIRFHLDHVFFLFLVTNGLQLRSLEVPIRRIDCHVRLNLPRVKVCLEGESLSLRGLSSVNPRGSTWTAF